MAALPDDDGIRLAQFGPNVVVPRGNVSKGAKDVDVCDGLCSLSDRAGMISDLRAHAPEYLGLQFGQAVLSIQDSGFVLLHLRCDEPLSTDECLPSDVVVGHRAEIRVGDLYVVPKHLVVADFERLDACALSLP